MGRDFLRLTQEANLPLVCGIAVKLSPDFSPKNGKKPLFMA
jgi:hypothetical protein